MTTFLVVFDEKSMLRMKRVLTMEAATKESPKKLLSQIQSQLDMLLFCES